MNEGPPGANLAPANWTFYILRPLSTRQRLGEGFRRGPERCGGAGGKPVKASALTPQLHPPPNEIEHWTRHFDVVPRHHPGRRRRHPPARLGRMPESRQAKKLISR